jgi:transcriptional regulator with XRE-family HTH domain
MSAVGQRFAENLKRELAKSPFTQDDVAARAEIHRTQIPKLLKGDQIPRLDTVVRLAGAMGIEPIVLIEGIAWTPGEPITGEFQ